MCLTHRLKSAEPLRSGASYGTSVANLSANEINGNLGREGRAGNGTDARGL